MKTKEWSKEHELNWSDHLLLTKFRRTRFQERVLKELKLLLETEEITFNIKESEIVDRESQLRSSQMIKVEIVHECLKNSYIYANQLDFTSDDQN